MSEEGAPSDALPGAELDWRNAVEILEDVELTEVVRRRLPAEGDPPAISVTDLLALRQSYWEAIAPVPIAPERAARMQLGRDLHRRIGGALASYGPREVRLRREGIVGRVDVLADVPIELKTGASAVAAPDLPDARPDQIEQLAIYAALLDRPGGRLVSAMTDGDAIASFQVVDLDVTDPAAVRSEAILRRDRLRAAWRGRSPAGLPRCPWFGRGCDYRVAGACDCTGSEPAEPSRILGATRVVGERPEIALELRGRLAAPGPAAPSIERFRDLLYLRRTYFERTTESPPPERPARDPSSAADLYERLRAAVESGPVGEVANLSLRADDVAEDVPGFRGRPWIERVTRSWERPRPEGIPERFPQYLLELGFRCVAVGATSGYLFLGWDRASLGSERVLVFEVRLTAPTRFARLWRDRRRRLEAAIAERAPRSLEPCPGWMPGTCPYVAECGCADESGRSHR